MTYSLSVHAPSKTEAILAAEAEFARAKQYQPVHARDEKLAFDNLRAQIAVLRDPNDGEDVHVSMHGYLVVDALSDAVTGLSAACCVGIARRTGQAL